MLSAGSVATAVTAAANNDKVRAFRIELFITDISMLLFVFVRNMQHIFWICQMFSLKFFILAQKLLE